MTYRNHYAGVAINLELDDDLESMRVVLRTFIGRRLGMALGRRRWQAEDIRVTVWRGDDRSVTCDIRVIMRRGELLMATVNAADLQAAVELATQRIRRTAATAPVAARQRR